MKVLRYISPGPRMMRLVAVATCSLLLLAAAAPALAADVQQGDSVIIAPGEVINDVTVAKPESLSGREKDDQQVTIGVRVPDNVVGLVVGPKGATIKRIRSAARDIPGSTGCW